MNLLNLLNFKRFDNNNKTKKYSDKLSTTTTSMDQDSDSPLKRFIEDLPEKEEEEKKDEIFERSSSFGLADLFHQKKGDYAIFIPPPPTSITL